jgi:hypothetical protein
MKTVTSIPAGFSLFASRVTDAPRTYPDPKGGMHGCMPFSDRAVDGESENPLGNETLLIASSGKALSFGYFSLLAPQVALALRASFAVRARYARKLFSFGKHACDPKTPLPSPPLPSQGRELEA